MTGGAGDQIELQEGDSNLRSCSAYRPGFLARLRRSQAGNVLPMMAMAIIPLAGLVGGGVDMSRMYIAKSRLQQACDSGALAGRKVQGAGAWDADGDGDLSADPPDDPPQAAALQFFDQNYPDGLYGTTNRTRAYSESAGRVTGTASAVVPMMIMKLFGNESQTISVVCDAEMRLPNTDIMFVLDTTQSMEWNAPGDSQPKITGLRRAVKCFYEVVAKLNTNEVCPGPAPAGGTAGVQIRFGFMPYATNVNVGRLLPPSFFANSWSYQTRKRNPTPSSYSTNTSNGNWPSSGSSLPAWSSWSGWTTHSSNTGVDDDDCDDPNDSTTYSPETSTSNASTDSNGVTTTTTNRTRTATQTEYRDTWTNQAGPGGLCLIEKRTRTRLETRVDTVTQTPIYTWNYSLQPHDISALKTGGTVSDTNPYGYASGVALPIGKTGLLRGTNQTVAWNGCIEERVPTVQATSYYPIPSTAYDLQIDLLPNQADSTTLWGPALHGALFIRSSATPETDSTVDSYSNSGVTNYCSSQARKLSTMAAADIDTYIDNLDTDGMTYHDIGILWGARFMSPTGIFRSENEFTPQGGAIDRHMIFMTDGETCTDINNYFAYGYPKWDKRQSATTPTNNATCPNPFGITVAASGVLNDQVNARFSAICSAVKNQLGVTLWVVYFGTTDAATTTRMTNCATTGRFYQAGNTNELITTFRQIADQISQLRLTR
jgi:Flp pilus assembly protein TadG